MQDLEIARNTKLENVLEIGRKIGIQENDIICYGNDKAKIKNHCYQDHQSNPNGKLVLVTSINPTPLGEGKTTVSIGLADGLCRLGKNAVLALREPSLGPVFGVKGGATGGGHAQIAPMEDINLHFTGDLHAITAANKLLAAMIDNHIYFGNELQIKKVTWKRCLDVNDRALRRIEINLDGSSKSIPREDGFDITAASEIMAILCLAEDLEDLKEKLGHIMIGYDQQNQPVYASSLKAEGAMLVLLKDAFQPNLVQTLEHTPAFIHGGPFANIAHGCNSIVATKTALKLADYVVTEAGFGADLGAEKFFNIKCRKTGLQPDAVVCVATIRALKYHGGMPMEQITQENLAYLKKGMKNLIKHVNNLKQQFHLNVVVALNQFTTDKKQEIEFVRSTLQKEGTQVSLVEAWEKGGEGGEDLAKHVIALSEKPCHLQYTYQTEDCIQTKIEKVARNIYGAEKVEYSEESKKEMDRIQEMGYGHLPICIAKTQYSFSDDPKNLLAEEPFTIHVKNLVAKSGAGFIVVYTGHIYTMPGLPKVPAAENIGIDTKDNIVGIF